MATQAQVDSFNAAIASGNFGLAADIAAGAGYGAADVEAYIEANAGNLGFDPGIDIPSDVVASYFDAPPVSYGPPSPAVSPAVSNSISLTPAGIAALAPSANVSSPANVFSPADYGPPSPPPAAPPTASPAEIQRMQAQRAEAELLRLREAERPIVDPRPQPAVDPVAQKYVNDFNALIDQGNYDGAARLVKEAELAGYGDEAYRAAAVALDANTNLPPEIDFISPQGIQSIRDYVNTATAPPPAPVDPNVEKFNSLIRANNFDEAGVLATNSGFTPEQVLTYLNDPNIFPEFGGNVTLDTVKSFVPKPPAPPPAAPLSFTDQLNALFQTNLGRLPTEREAEIYAKDFGGTFSPELEAAFLSRSTEEMGNRQKGIDAANAIQTKETDTAAANAEGRPGPGQIFGIPRLARQTQSNVPFAPLRRGLAQLRPAMYMPGLTSGQAPLGGSGFTPEALRTVNQGLSLADRAYLMDVVGVSPAEASAAVGTPVGQIQAEYNQSRPGGLFSTEAPAPRGLPEDFALQTGAYGAPTPTFFTPAPAKTTSPSGSSSANANQPGSIGGSGGDGEGIEGDPNSSGFSFSGFGFGCWILSNDPSNDPSSGFTGSVSGTGSPGDDDSELEVLVLIMKSVA
jgi:hypothetical protein